MIAGWVQPDSGTIEIGQTVKIGYFSQENEAMDENLKVIDYIRNVAEYVQTKDGSISASQMLYMLGIYESTLKAISSLDILALLPLAVGGIMGTYLTARILEQLIKKHREATFLMILGFMLASLPELLPGHLAQENLLFCVMALAAGFVSLYLVTLK